MIPHPIRSLEPIVIEKLFKLAMFTKPVFNRAVKSNSQLTQPEAARMAAEWKVSTRTLFNWRRSGVDIFDSRAVAEHIASQRSPSPSALKAALEAIEPIQ